jgi:hypothetical protein
MVHRARTLAAEHFFTRPMLAALSPEQRLIKEIDEVVLLDVGF